MFTIRNLMVNASALQAARAVGPVVCIWPSIDCCGPNFSYPGGGGQGMSFFTTIGPTAPPDVGCELLSRDPGGCGLNYSTCFGGSVFDLQDHIRRVINPAELKALRLQLDRVVELAEAQQTIADEQFSPTEEELDLMEGQLRAMQDTLAEQRSKLAKGG